MPIPYFRGLHWNDLTREERFYCYMLYSCAKGNPADFAAWLNSKAGLDLDLKSEWELGVEVCFYRDYLWHRGEGVRNSRYSPKRTFDLCLFGREDIVVIEAKVEQPFNSLQADIFSEDTDRIKELLSPYTVNVWLVALASSKYLKSHALRGHFHGSFSWADTYEKYTEKHLKQADELFGSENHKLLGPERDRLDG